MSWTVAVTDVEPKDVYDALDAAAEKYWATYTASPEMKLASADAATKAAQVAADIANSGVVGTNVKLNVTIGGHANPEHKPLEGWSNDFIQVTITQR